MPPSGQKLPPGGALQHVLVRFCLISGQRSVQRPPAKAALLGARRAPSIAALASAKCFPGAPWWPKTATRWCFTACFGSFLPYIWPTVGPTAPSKGCFAGGPKGPQHSSPSKRKMLPWCPLVAKNCHQMVLYSMFWFVFALYLANGHSDDTISPEPALEEFRCKEIFDQECSCDGFRPLKIIKKCFPGAPWWPKTAKTISPEPAPEEFRCKEIFDQECSWDGFRPIK